MSDPFPDEIDEALWDEACRRADAIRGFLRRHPARTTAGNVAGLAAELDLSQATAYRMVKLFRAGGTVLSLVDRKRGRPEGHRMLDEKREEIVRTTINAFYLKRTRPTVSQLVRDVQTNCMLAGLKPPHRRTIVARLGDIDLQKRARRRGDQRRRSACAEVRTTHLEQMGCERTVRNPCGVDPTQHAAKATFGAHAEIAAPDPADYRGHHGEHLPHDQQPRDRRRGKRPRKHHGRSDRKMGA